MLSTFKQALDGAVTDEEELSSLVCDPSDAQGRWNDPTLQELRRRLDRNYDIFVDNVAGLSELLDRLAKKLGIDMNNPNVGKVWPLFDCWQTVSYLN